MMGVDNVLGANNAHDLPAMPSYSSMTDYATSHLLDAYHRRLAATYSKIDYTVLSVALLTLGLILVVEIARHKIDRRAHGRPFAKTVLEQVYRELSTLGIVEFAIFLGHTYAPNFNLEVEAVFAKVHFLLFFTAIINALMSVILSFVASHISYKLWVRTEELELNHYIAIREEFSRVEKLLGEYEGSGGTDAATEYHVLTPKRALTRVMQTLRYPILRRQYDKLLVQVRFHELRVHFLEANDLPLKFKVSDYLVKSELHVFKKCVHISTLAWIMVAAAVNIVYFLMGIVAYASGSQKVVGKAMSWIFIGGCLAFIPISYAIFLKMQWIFAQIMKMKLIDHRKGGHHRRDGEDGDDEGEEDDVEDEDYDNYSASIDAASLDNDQSTGGRSRRSRRASYVLNVNVSGRSGDSGRKRRKKAMSQLDLFWLNDPHLVIGAFQFMQLGYSIAASILLIFWDYIDVYYASISGKWFILALVLCYLTFLWIMAQVVPRYTLCTSLGQLVNPRRLQETLAKCKLEEAKRKRRHLMEERKIMLAVEKEAREKAEQERLSAPPITEGLKKRASLDGTSGGGSASQGSQAPIFALNSARPPPKYQRDVSTDRFSNHSLESEKMNELAKLVKRSNADLPTTGQSLADIRRERRKRRMRSVSDGVAFMRKMAESTGSSEAAMSVLAQEDTDKTKLPVPLTKSASGRALESGLLPEPFDPSRSRSAEDAIPGRRRRSRKKSLSSNVALMRSPASSLFDPTLSLVTEEKDEDESPLKPAPRRPSLDSGLPTLIEGIPSRSVNTNELRQSTEKVSEARNKPATATNAPAIIDRQSSHGDASSDSSIIAKTVGDIGGGSSRDLADDIAAAGPGDEKAGADDDQGDVNDDDTIDTAASDQSFDIVPDVAVSVKSAKHRQEEAQTANHNFTVDKMRDFMQTQSYRLMSGVFGTMIAFFLVGMRVEIFLIEMGTIPDNKNTWNLNLTGSFWWEVAWLSSFIAISIASTALFFHGCHDNDHLHLVVAGSFDVLLSGLCLALLLGAEVRRCCADGGDCCSQFGSRTYGGLGSIEPWTAIVAFRVFRYNIGRGVRRMFRRRAAQLKDDSDASTVIDYTKSRRNQREEKADEYGYMGKENKHAVKARANFEAETGNIVDLWNSAIGLYPDVVKQYGEFSGELLQAMLGIEIVEGAAPLSGSMAAAEVPAKSPAEVETRPRPSEDSIFGNAGSKRGSHATATLSSSVGGATSSLAATPLPSLDKMYCNLDPECQGIILAGRIGRPVRQRSRRPPRGSTDSDDFFLNSLRSQGPSESIRSLTPGSPGQSPVRRSSGTGGGPVFVVDKQQDKEEHTGEDESMLMFADPNARLIRSMRRCERRLPPMLNEWAVVDVVITKYEIVYFDATDVDDLGPLPSATTAATEVDALELQHKRDTVRQALIATKGGKGLRLRDIALGRKIVGHLELSEFTGIKVERFSPLPHKEDEGLPDVDLEDGYSMHQDEYWQKTKTPTAHRARQHRWKHAMEDRLKLVSTQGDLYLRFFTDLEEWENNSSRAGSAGSDIVKNQTLLWTQTIGRLCGTDQLQQKLPHLGDDGSAELLDYLEFLSRELDDADGPSTKTTLHRRLRSRVNLQQLGEMMRIDAAAQQQPSGDGGVALGVASGQESAPSPGASLKKRLRRKTSGAVTFADVVKGEEGAAKSDMKVNGDAS